MGGRTSTKRVKRGHSGCQSCKRRGKKCDEARPECGACERLQLDCSYVAAYTFCVSSATATGYENSSSNAKSIQAASRQPCQTNTCSSSFWRRRKLDRGMNITPLLPHNNDAAYMAHFHHSVCFNLFGQLRCLASMLAWEPCVRYAVLSISASHLAVLQGSTLKHYLKRSPKRSFTESAIYRTHHRQSVRYAKLAEACLNECDTAADMRDQVAATAFAKILLALYYHMAIDHLHFKATVSNTLSLVRDNYQTLCDSAKGEMVLRCWYRLHLSCRPSKSPGLPLDGEASCNLFPTFAPSSLDDQIDLECNLRLSGDDLIYSILIKIIELRSRLITIRCVAANRNGSEPDVKFNTFDDDLPRKPPSQYNGKVLSYGISSETTSSQAIQSSLFELLYIQEQRLKLWKTVVNFQEHDNQTALHEHSGHRQSMNRLYGLLCELIILELRAADSTSCISSTTSSHPPHGQTVESATAKSVASLIAIFFSITDSLDYAQSNLQDTYTFSLTEILRQLVYSWPAEAVFEHILNITWPKIERNGPGFEHSHLPTPLAKRFIMYLKEEYLNGRHVVLTSNMMPENTPKFAYLDSDNDVRILVYTTTGCDGGTLQSVQAYPVCLPGGH